MDLSKLTDVEVDVLLDGLASLMVERANGKLRYYDLDKHEALTSLAHRVATEHLARGLHQA